MRSITKKEPEIFFNIMELFDPYTAVPYTSMYNFTFLMMLIYLMADTMWMKFNPLFKSTFFVSNIIFESMENSNYKYKFINILMVALMTYIMMMNFLGMMPYNFSMTSSPTINFSISFIFFFSIILNFMKNSSSVLTHLVPKSSPTMLIFILVMIETMSILIRPITLGLRITANIMAGHVILTIMSSMISSLDIGNLILMNFIMLVNTLELMVAVIQAYVMMMLLNYCLKDFTE